MLMIQRWDPLTGSSSQAAINASYGLLKAEVEIPLRSSNVLAWLDMMVLSIMYLGSGGGM